MSAAASALVPLLSAAAARAIRGRPRKRTRNPAQTRVQVRAPKRRRTGGHRRPTNSLTRQLALPEVVRAYINTLNDPFTYPGVKLGWGCMLPTSVYTLYVRGNFNTNADGSFAVFMAPQLVNNGITNLYPIQYNVGGAASTTWNNLATWTNVTNVSASASAGRVVSGGIKVYPQVPATSVPGVLAAMSIPTGTSSGILAQTPTTLSYQPYAEIGYGATGASGVTRPQDVSSFDMDVRTILGNTSSTTVFDCSIPAISGIGFPPTTNIWYEAVLNVETLMNYTDASGAITSMNQRLDSTETLATHHASFDSMWQAIKHLVGPGQVVNHASTTPAAVRQQRTGGASLRHQFFAGPQTNRMTLRMLE
jgi:hypothetical protein